MASVAHCWAETYFGFSFDRSPIHPSQIATQRLRSAMTAASTSGDINDLHSAMSHPPFPASNRFALSFARDVRANVALFVAASDHPLVGAAAVPILHLRRPAAEGALRQIVAHH